MIYHPEIQTRFLAFMVWRGETEITPRRASEMIKRDKCFTDFRKFIYDLMVLASEKSSCVSTRPSDNSKAITNHQEFSNFIWLNMFDC